MFLLLFIQILICSIPRLLIRSSLYLFFHPFIIQYDPRNSDDGDDGDDDHDENEDDNDDDNDVDENYGENHDENQIQFFLMKMIIIMMVGTMVIIT